MNNSIAVASCGSEMHINASHPGNPQLPKHFAESESANIRWFVLNDSIDRQLFLCPYCTGLSFKSQAVAEDHLIGSHAKAVIYSEGWGFVPCRCPEFYAYRGFRRAFHYHCVCSIIFYSEAAFKHHRKTSCKAVLTERGSQVQDGKQPGFAVPILRRKRKLDAGPNHGICTIDLDSSNEASTSSAVEGINDATNAKSAGSVNNDGVAAQQQQDEPSNARPLIPGCKLLSEYSGFVPSLELATGIVDRFLSDANCFFSEESRSATFGTNYIPRKDEEIISKLFWEMPPAAGNKSASVPFQCVPFLLIGSRLLRCTGMENELCCPAEIIVRDLLKLSYFELPPTATVYERSAVETRVIDHWREGLIDNVERTFFVAFPNDCDHSNHAQQSSSRDLSDRRRAAGLRSENVSPLPLANGEPTPAASNVGFCNICKRDFLTNEALLKHAMVAHKKCAFCNVMLRRDVTWHMASSHKELFFLSSSTEESFRCRFCPRYFRVRSHLIKHYAVEHLLGTSMQQRTFSNYQDFSAWQSQYFPERAFMPPAYDKDAQVFRQTCLSSCIDHSSSANGVNSAQLSGEARIRSSAEESSGSNDTEQSTCCPAFLYYYRATTNRSERNERVAAIYCSQHVGHAEQTCDFVLDSDDSLKPDKTGLSREGASGTVSRPESGRSFQMVRSGSAGEIDVVSHVIASTSQEGQFVVVKALQAESCSRPPSPPFLDGPATDDGDHDYLGTDPVIKEVQQDNELGRCFDNTAATMMEHNNASIDEVDVEVINDKLRDTLFLFACEYCSALAKTPADLATHYELKHFASKARLQFLVFTTAEAFAAWKIDLELQDLIRFRQDNFVAESDNARLYLCGAGSFSRSSVTPREHRRHCPAFIRLSIDESQGERKLAVDFCALHIGHAKEVGGDDAERNRRLRLLHFWVEIDTFLSAHRNENATSSSVTDDDGSLPRLSTLRADAASPLDFLVTAESVYASKLKERFDANGRILILRETFNAGRLCGSCNTQFKTKELLDYHLKLAHPSPRTLPGGKGIARPAAVIACLLCGLAMPPPSLRNLVFHYNTVHGKKLSLAVRSFSGMSAFIAWKDSLNDDYLVERRRSYRAANGAQQRYWTCRCSGQIMNPAMGVYGGYCTAWILAEKPKGNGGNTINVVACVDHYGHRREPAASPHSSVCAPVTALADGAKSQRSAADSPFSSTPTRSNRNVLAIDGEPDRADTETICSDITPRRASRSVTLSLAQESTRGSLSDDDEEAEDENFADRNGDFEDEGRDESRSNCGNGTSMREAATPLSTGCASGTGVRLPGETSERVNDATAQVGAQETPGRYHAPVGSTRNFASLLEAAVAHGSVNASAAVGFAVDSSLWPHVNGDDTNFGGLVVQGRRQTAREDSCLVTPCKTTLFQQQPSGEWTQHSFSSNDNTMLRSLLGGGQQHENAAANAAHDESISSDCMMREILETCGLASLSLPEGMNFLDVALEPGVNLNSSSDQPTVVCEAPRSLPVLVAGEQQRGRGCKGVPFSGHEAAGSVACSSGAFDANAPAGEDSITPFSKLVCDQLQTRGFVRVSIRKPSGMVLLVQIGLQQMPLVQYENASFYAFSDASFTDVVTQMLQIRGESLSAGDEIQVVTDA